VKVKMSTAGKEMTLKELKEITEEFVENGGIADEGRARSLSISYRNYFSSEEGFLKCMKTILDYDPTRYPDILYGSWHHLETHNLSPASLEAIEKHKLAIFSM
jgi:hypothetical protein